MQHYSDRSFIDRYPLSPKKIWKKMLQGIWANIVLIAVFAFVFGIGLAQVYNDYEEELGPFFKRHGVTMLMVAFCISVYLYVCSS
jgi:uncharacterized membrane protein YeiB